MITKLTGLARQSYASLKKAYYRNVTIGQIESYYAKHKPVLSEAQQKVLTGLQQNGIAMISFDELFGAQNQLWKQLEAEIAAFMDSPKVRQQVLRYKNTFKQIDSSKAEGDYKQYIAKYYQFKSAFNEQNPLLQLGAHPLIVDTISNYFESLAMLRGMEAWYTIAVNEERPKVNSQNWHRDPEDNQLVKIFVYFSDVDERSGAMEYVANSQQKGKFGQLFPIDSQHAYSYPSAEDLSNNIPAEHFVRCSGKKGTILFCDTYGFHRGGYCIDRDRILATYMYLKPTNICSNQYRLEIGNKTALSEKQRLVLSL